MADESTSEQVTARMGFFPFVSGEHVEVLQAGAAMISARGDLTLTQGGTQMARVGGDMRVQQGGVQTLLSRGDVSIEQGGVLLGAARSVRVDNGLVGVAVGRDVQLNDSRVLLTQQNAIVFGVVAGVVAAVLARILRR